MSIKDFLTHANISSHTKAGILICPVENQDTAIKLTKDILYDVVTDTTAVFLSGGRTPKQLYTDLAREAGVTPGAVALVDERYGPVMHEHSNEKMIRETGLVSMLEKKNVPFSGILQPGLSRQQTADTYEKKVRSLIQMYPTHVALLGIGADGHTAGVAGMRADFINPLFTKEKDAYVGEFDDATGIFKERITLTFAALSQLDVLILLVLGEDKKDALQKMFEEGREEDIPARFFKREGVSGKTLLITDQKV